MISGLHLLEGQNVDIKREKLNRLRHHLQQISSSIPVHLELASMTSSTLMIDIAQQIFPLVDSIGLNEQEMAFLSLSLEGPGGQDELLQHPPEIGNALFLYEHQVDWRQSQILSQISSMVVLFEILSMVVFQVCFQPRYTNFMLTKRIGFANKHKNMTLLSSWIYYFSSRNCVSCYCLAKQNSFNREVLLLMVIRNYYGDINIRIYRHYFIL